MSTNYDFRALHDKEFEILCNDLLSKHESKSFERFKPGKDGGVDGRCFDENGEEIILQCKHKCDSHISNLKNILKTKEKTKIDKLNPVRYILAVSNPLSRNLKQEISQILHPHIKSVSDIYGKDDLNYLISLYFLVNNYHNIYILMYYYYILNYL